MANPLKAAIQAIFPGGAGGSFSFTPRTANVASMEVAALNSAVFACANTIARAFPEPKLQILREQEDGEDEEQIGHPMIARLRRPNPSMSLYQLWYVTQFVQNIDGNAYWWKIKTGDKSVVQLWPLDPSLVEPKWPRDGSEWISHYEYKPNSRKIEIPRDDIVHFRLGIDRDNPRKGKSGVSYVLSEIMGDEEATRFTAAILANYGIPPVVISVKGNVPVPEIERMKAEFERRYGQNNRGRVGVLTHEATAVKVGYSPSEMNMDFAHRLPEERISAAMEVPAIVAGLGAGLDRATYANFQEAREMFTETTMANRWRMAEEQLDLQLLPDFALNEDEYCAFDIRTVRALQPDMDKIWARATPAAQTALITRADFKRQVGLKPSEDGTDDVYLLPMSVFEVPVGDPAPNSLPADGDEPKRLRLPVERKARQTAAARLHRALVLSQVRAQAKATKTVQAAFDALADDVSGRVKAAQEASDIWPGDSEATLRTGIEVVFIEQSKTAWDLVSEAVGLEGRWAESDPHVSVALEQAGQRIVAINDATRSAVQRVLSENVDAPREELRAKVRATVRETYAGRSAAIARTELRMATNQTSAGRYDDAGVTMVDVIDGDEDDLCSERNGQRVDLETFREWDSTEHPNGTISALPVID